MYMSGQQEMKSASWLQGHAGDRPSFRAIVCRTFSTRPFHVFAMPQGLLFLELRQKPGAPGTPNTGAIVLGGVLGGAIGACVAGAIANSASDPSRDENFDLCSEDELFQIAAQRRRSFVVKNDDILSVSIDAPTGLSKMFADSSLAGYIILRARRPSKVAMEIHDQAAMSVAVDAFPRRLAQRCSVNVELDRQTMKFRARGR